MKENIEGYIKSINMTKSKTDVFIRTLFLDKFKNGLDFISVLL